MFSHCSILWHHPACSSLTISGQIRWKIPQAVSWLYSFHLLQTFDIEMKENRNCHAIPSTWAQPLALLNEATDSHPPKAVFACKLVVNWSPGTCFKFPSFGSQGLKWPLSSFTNVALEWKFLEATQNYHKLPSLLTGAVKTLLEILQDS